MVRFRLAPIAVAILCSHALHVQRARAAGLVGKEAPELQLSSVANARADGTLAAMPGQVVVLVFCRPDRLIAAMVGAYVNLFRVHAAEKVAVAAVTTDSRAVVDALLAEQKAEKHEVTFPVGVDDDQKTTRAYGAIKRHTKLPHVVLIGSSGIVIWEGEWGVEDIIYRGLAAAKGVKRQFELKDGRTIVGKKRGRIGKQTLLMSEDGQKMKVATADIVGTSYVPASPDVDREIINRRYPEAGASEKGGSSKKKTKGRRNRGRRNRRR